MKVHLFVLLLVACAALSVPAVSAAVVEEKNGYIVAPGTDNLRLPVISPMSSSSISQGQTQWYSTAVPARKTSFFADLNWGASSDSLSLTIYAPDATFGPYYDAADGRTDGRINLRISKTGGIATGTWWSAVYGSRVNGVRSYTYSASVS